MMADQMLREHLRELVRVSRMFGAMLSTGVPILQALQITARQAAAPYDQAFLAIHEGIMHWNDRPRTMGELLADQPALFPAAYRRLVHVGEHTGTLDEMCLLAGDLLEPVAQGAEADDTMLETAVTRLLFTRQFADLVASGMAWPRCLMILGYEAFPPFDEVAKGLMQNPPGVKRWSPLSERMEQWPALFPPFYRAMVSTGEGRGHRLDDALKNLLVLLEEDWHFSRLLGWPDGRASLILAGEGTSLPAWEELDAAHQRIILLLFCRTISLLCTAELPVAQALATAALLLPDARRDSLLEIASAEPPQSYTAVLETLHFLPEFALTIFRAGEVGGIMAYSMNRAADVYRAVLPG